MSKYFEVNYPAFEFLTKFYEHEEPKRNLEKLRRLKNQLNADQAKIDKQETRKARRKGKK